MASPLTGPELPRPETTGDGALSPPSSPDTDLPAPTAGITVRAFVLGTLLIPLMVYWVQYTEIVAEGTDLAAMSLIIPALFGLFILICLNGMVSRVAPRWKLTQVELLFIYVMQTISVCISGIGMMQCLVTTLGNGLYSDYAAANGWKDLFYRALPTHLLPDPEVLPRLYRGNSHLSLEYLAGWAGPIAWWTAFIFVLLGSMLCLNVLLRKQWIDNEKLPFPIVYLPLEITRSDPENGPIWRNPLFWFAFMIPVVLESLASLNYLYPSIPALPLKPTTLPNLSAELKQPPWNALGGSLTLGLYPFVIGMIYFLPTDVSFSLWFFYLFSRMEDVVAVATGLRVPGAPPAMARMPYHGEQAAGAFLGFALIGFWTYRKYLAAVFGKAFGEHAYRNVSDENEPCSYRTAVIGFAVGFALLCWFSWAGGMVWWLPVAFFLAFFLYAITYTRARAEAGLPLAYGPAISPHSLVIDVGGSANYDVPSLTMMTYLHWSDYNLRSLVMPHQLEAMKIANSTTGPARMNSRHLFWVILWSTFVGTLSTWWSILSIYYQYGAATGNVNAWRTTIGTIPFRILSDWIKNPVAFEPGRLYGIFAGFGITGALMVLRTRFLWWPFHPVGYILGETNTMGWLWSPTLIGWLIKVLVLRYGGIRLFRCGIPFFIGLVLGDYVISCIWTLLG
ncbi:MAG: DUF6785 family protein [Armatimonadota bacterium]